jgi:hypothetical protein
MAAQGPFDWQGRLATEGKVVFGVGRWLSWLLLVATVLGIVAALAGFVGRSVWQIVCVVFLVGCAWYLARAALTGSGQLTVTGDGVRMGTGPTVTWDRLVAVATARERVTVFYDPLPDERLTPFERRTGQKRLLLALSRWGPVRSDDLAVWLLKLKGGPMAEIDSRLGGAGMARVYRIRD